MEVIYLLIPLSLAFLALAVWFFLWAMKTEQYEDLEGPAHRIILDDQEERRQLAESGDSSSEPAAQEKHHD